ncbi:transmembrane protein 42 isoform X1 [Linepithema humile]|uniref:transmembrane protein 42 isoform X1 n=1 Tax=Linepithema humile TaxID=83485 RepID=UPI0006233720|nr:PREDICTED: transmembrane protein 42 [Linepithema humile]
MRIAIFGFCPHYNARTSATLSADMEGHRSDGVSGAYLAVAAGIFATGGSLLGKLASGVDALSLLSLLLKGALLVCMIVSNTVGCTFFVKALHTSGSSLPITIASAATNYICSAFVGFVVFDESTSLVWWCGTSLVLSGLILICYVPAEKDTSVEGKLKHQ